MEWDEKHCYAQEGSLGSNGGFNAICEVEDRIGSTVRISEVAPMSECLMFCNLVDVKASDRHFIWNNK